MNPRSLFFSLAALYGPLLADNVPFAVTDNLFDQSDTTTLGLSAATGTETFTVFAPVDSTDHYSNGVVLMGFDGWLYCQWQSSATNEDSTDTWVAYSRSQDGETWSEPMVIQSAVSNGYVTSGGWWVNGDTLVAFVNYWPDSLDVKGGFAYFKTSTDGLAWSDLQPVTLLDGSAMAAVMEQDPHALPSGRIVGAAHFQPGIFAAPIYTDDPSGVRGWVRADYTNLTYSSTSNSQEMEPSWFQRADSALVMIFRDQSSTYYKLASVSTDSGATWTEAVLTNMPDSRAKQSAGNLPDGTAYMVNNPRTSKSRIPLALTLSEDGQTFDKAYLLRAGGDDLQAQRYSGKYKTLGYSYPKSVVWGDFLYAGYATNKEDVQITRVPFTAIQLDTSRVRIQTAEKQASLFSLPQSFKSRLFIHTSNHFHYQFYGLNGKSNEAGASKGNASIGNSLPPGLYLLKIQNHQTSQSIWITKQF